MKDARIKFTRRTPLQAALDGQVKQYFDSTGLSRRGGGRMITKTAVIMAWWAISYALALGFVGGVAGFLVASVSLGLAIAGLGFCVMHDGNHGAFSESKRMNRWMGAVCDFIGGSSYVWRHKHNIMHHTYPNIVGADDDIDIGPLARMAPDQAHHGFHRFQHLYMWVLYGFISTKWHFWDDYAQIGSGKIAGQHMPRPKGKELATFVVGRVLFYAWAVVIPIAVLGLGYGVLFYFTSQFVLGVTLATVFQLAHCVEEADFPSVAAHGKTEVDFYRLQLDTTVDFARGHPFVTWYLGGLNYQAVHHLYPKISHVHYPEISKIVERVCAEHGVDYRTAGTFRVALRSHYRWLKRMGEAPADVATDLLLPEIEAEAQAAAA